MRHDFTTLCPGGLPEGFTGEGWGLAAVARHPRNTTAIKAVDSPDYHVAFPSICKASSGDLLVVYREGLTHATSEDPHDGKIALIRSSDGGRTWSERVIIMDGDDYDDRNAAIACGFPPCRQDAGAPTARPSFGDGAGRRTAGFQPAAVAPVSTPPCRQDAGAPTAQLLVCWDKWKPRTHRGAFAMLSDDDGHTWSDPIRLQPIEDVHTRSPALMLKDGNWLIPLAEGEGGGQAAYGVILDPRTGESEMVPITPPGDEELADEVCVTRTLTPRPPLPGGEGENGAAGGALVALGRHWRERYLWQTRSTDEGRTWETPWLSSIPSQYTPADLITLHNGWLLCSFSFRERRNERLVLSKDHGATWEVENSIDVFDGTMAVGGDRSYPASVQIDEDTIGTVLYETQAHPAGGAIYFVTSQLSEFDRPPVTALYASCQAAGPLEGPLEGPRFSRPLSHGVHELRLRYRFTGLFGDAPNRLEVALDDLTFAYQMGATEDRQGAINYVEANGEGHEAVGDWFDDGNEHELTLRRAGVEWTLSLDGHEQITAAGAEAPMAVTIAAVRAGVAVYELEIT